MARTSIKGRHWFQLEWEGGRWDSGGAASLRVAVHEQLGLRLEERSAPLPTLVIDQVEKPAGD